MLSGKADYIGNSIANGHYTAIVKHGEEWIQCDDEIVTKVEDSLIASGNNYVYLYVKIHDNIRKQANQKDTKKSNNSRNIDDVSAGSKTEDALFSSRKNGTIKCTGCNMEFKNIMISRKTLNIF